MPLWPSNYRKGLGALIEDGATDTFGFEKLGVSLHGATVPRDHTLEGSIPVVNGRRMILNQQGTSSCVAHAFVGGIHIEEQRAGLTFEPASRLYAYFNSRKEHQTGVAMWDTGTYLRTMAVGLRKFGCPPESHWSWSQQTFKVNKRPDWQAMRHAHARRGGQYVKIYETGKERTRVVQLALLSGFTVAFGTRLGVSFLGAGNQWIDVPPATEEIAGNHAMLIVGWTTTGNGKLWFRVLNSWGGWWRDGGLCWLSSDYIEWMHTHDLHVIHGWERVGRRRG